MPQYKQPVQQIWTFSLPWKMQTVMLQGLRAPDTHFCKNIKTVSRWMRSIVLNNADKTHTFMCRKEKLALWEDLENELNYCSMHFTTHFLYCLEIIGYKHPDKKIREIAYSYYYDLSHHMMHFNIETEIELDTRLADNTTVPYLIEVEEIKQEIPKQCPSGKADNYTWQGY